MVEYFSDCILSGMPPHLDPTEGLADVRILRAIKRATETGQTQKLAPFSVDGSICRSMIRALP